jgi:pyridoxal/pyridoxine/pyridoxamine kinase
MRLEYLPAGAPECPLVRLFDFSSEEAAQLRAAAEALAAGRLERVTVHELPEVEAVGCCELVWCLRSREQGAFQVGPAAFECGLTGEGWLTVAAFIEPFAAGSTGFQWLVSEPGEVTLLLSKSGKW